MASDWSKDEDNRQETERDMRDLVKRAEFGRERGRGGTVRTGLVSAGLYTFLLPSHAKLPSDAISISF